MDALLSPWVLALFGIGVATLVWAALPWVVFPRNARPAVVFVVLHLTTSIGLMVYLDETTPFAPAVLTAALRLAFEAVAYRQRIRRVS
ncbi:hypothetical protein [Streptomyces sp. BK79]|uniref:hypothetical protein n=1 Tax=Streptomyces sp. BK79 TaxID=3350097 RepID=UPI00376F935F